MAQQPLVVIGEIRGIYGVKGWVKLFSWTSPKENLLNYTVFQDQNGRQWHLAQARAHGKGLIGRFKSIDTREQAAEIQGLSLRVARDSLPPLADDEYYWADLEGCQVLTISGELIGVVDHLLETGANDVLVVKDKQGTEELIPFVLEQVVTLVDVVDQRIVVDWSGSDLRA